MFEDRGTHIRYISGISMRLLHLTEITPNLDGTFLLVTLTRRLTLPQQSAPSRCMWTHHIHTFPTRLLHPLPPRSPPYQPHLPPVPPRRHHLKQQRRAIRRRLLPVVAYCRQHRQVAKAPLFLLALNVAGTLLGAAPSNMATIVSAPSVSGAENV